MTTNNVGPGATEPTLARRARLAAHDWVQSIGAGLPGFTGAWLAGSVAWLPDDEIVPSWSDVDVMVALADEAPPKIGKVMHRGVLLEISSIAGDQVTLPALNANYRVSCSFVQGRLLADPMGNIGQVLETLRASFWSHDAVLDRVAQARTASEAGLLPSSAPDTRSRAWQAMWVFPAGLPTHMVLIGAGQNPTVRRRYEKVHPIFASAGRLDLYEDLLTATGYGALTRTDVVAHWKATETLFDLAAVHSASASPFFASDISPLARPIAIDGTRDSIERGFHREALFWLVATQARSLAILEEVAPTLITEPVTSRFLDLVDGVGIATPADRANRAEAVLSLLPAIERFSIELISP